VFFWTAVDLYVGKDMLKLKPSVSVFSSPKGPFLLQPVPDADTRQSKQRKENVQECSNYVHWLSAAASGPLRNRPSGTSCLPEV